LWAPHFRSRFHYVLYGEPLDQGEGEQEGSIYGRGRDAGYVTSEAGGSL
jgi:hypothetical protein